MQGPPIFQLDRNLPIEIESGWKDGIYLEDMAAAKIGIFLARS